MILKNAASRVHLELQFPSMDEISIRWIEGYNTPGNSEVVAQDEDACTDGTVESDQNMAMGIEQYENKR